MCVFSFNHTHVPPHGFASAQDASLVSFQNLGHLTKAPLPTFLSQQWASLVVSCGDLKSNMPHRNLA